MEPNPKLVIRVRDGLTVFTQVLFDGKQLPVTRVRFDTGEDTDGLVFVSMTFLADIDIEIEGAALAVTALRASDYPEHVEIDFGNMKPEITTDRPIARLDADALAAAAAEEADVESYRRAGTAGRRFRRLQADKAV